MKKTSAIIIEDEPALADWLKSRLRALWPELEIVGVAHDGTTALELIDELGPDVAFLDIHLPGRSGLEVATSISGRCHIVFVTAYDQYAIEAFEAEAVDYLLKPIDDGRLEVTIQRLKARVESPPVNLEGFMANLPQAAKRYLEWIQAGIGDTIEFISVAQVSAFFSQEKLTYCWANEKQYILRSTLLELEAQLDPNQFWRIHRNAIVRVAAIEKVTKDSFGTSVWLRNYSRPLQVSRVHAWKFKGL